MSEKQWKIKDGQGKVFGPATLDVLKTWARDARIMPGLVASCDDKNWIPVESISELEMNWSAKLPDGLFFGPMHHDALKDFIRQGGVSEDSPIFVRVASIDDTDSALADENKNLKKQLEDLRSDFTSRVSKLEAELESALSERRVALSDLSTRDLEFDAERQAFEAERQSFVAECTKLKAAVAKAEKRADISMANATEIEARCRSSEIDMARISELEKLLQDSQEKINAMKEQLDKQDYEARKEKKEMDIRFIKEKDELLLKLRESEAYADKVKALESREETLRRLVGQLSSVFSSGDEAVVDAEEVIDIV